MCCFILHIAETANDLTNAPVMHVRHNKYEAADWLHRTVTAEAPGLPFETEAPVLTPSGEDFFFFLFFCLTAKAVTSGMTLHAQARRIEDHYVRKWTKHNIKVRLLFMLFASSCCQELVCSVVSHW